MASHGGVVTLNEAVLDDAAARQLSLPLTRGVGTTTVYRDSQILCYARALDEATGSGLYVDPSGLKVMFDGRLDRREILIAQLREAAEGDGSDAAVIAAAYRRWGVRCIEHLYGEWNVVVHDPLARHVLLATDFSGCAPLFFSCAASRLVWSSELAALGGNGLDSEIDREYILGMIVQHPELGRTPFANIRAVYPGHGLAFNASGVRVIPGWSPDLGAEIRYQRHGDYEEHFRSVFWQAVADRLRPAQRTWLELSGGRDTSSIVCTADAILRQRGHSADWLRPVVYMFSGLDADLDFQCAGAVLKHIGRHAEVIDGRASVLLPTIAEAALPVPSASGGIVPRLASAMRANGVRTLLSGEGGDGLMWEEHAHYGIPLAESLGAGRFGEFVRESLAYSREERVTLWHTLLTSVMKARRWRRARALRIPPWVNPAAALQYRAWVREECRPGTLSGCRLGAAMGSQLIDRTRRCIAAQPDRHTGAIDVSYPFMDRRLIQFMLSVPSRQKLAPGVSRWLQRRALNDVVPAAVWGRQKKSGGSAQFLRALRAEWPRVEALLSRSSCLAELKLVSVDKLRKAALDARDGAPADCGSIWRGLVAEAWLRSRTGVT
jgi:asparagine synthase (glutamine-hydrolysing)